MALTGTYSRTIDEKHRLAVPKRLRAQFATSGEEPSSLYVAPETENSLGLYSLEAFEKLATRLAERTTNRAEVQNFLRLFYARAERVDMDGQGRVRIPERLMEYAGLKRDVMLLGVHDHAEIWDSGTWEKFLAKHTADYDEMARKAFG